MVKKFVGAFLAGTANARAHPQRALKILAKVTASDPKFLARATPATLHLVGDGCLNLRAWQRFGQWMHTQGLLNTPIAAASVVDASLLPSRCR